MVVTWRIVACLRSVDGVHNDAYDHEGDEVQWI